MSPLFFTAPGSSDPEGQVGDLPRSLEKLATQNSFYSQLTENSTSPQTISVVQKQTRELKAAKSRATWIITLSKSWPIVWLQVMFYFFVPFTSPFFVPAAVRHIKFAENCVFLFCSQAAHRPGRTASDPERIRAFSSDLGYGL
ncbi:hypothetical protein QW131_10510 [Roseibium salinum]|nr:hypothetical protein [Roseibium salinum]